MKNIFIKVLNKLFLKQWIIGVIRGDINELIRNKTFNPVVHWMKLNTFNHFRADPFALANLYHAIVDAIPSESVIVGSQPSALIRETSSTFLGVPSGFLVSQSISP